MERDEGAVALLVQLMGTTRYVQGLRFTGGRATDTVRAG